MYREQWAEYETQKKQRDGSNTGTALDINIKKAQQLH